MVTLDWSQCPAVESVPGRRSGAWVFKATRVPVATVGAFSKTGLFPGMVQTAHGQDGSDPLRVDGQLRDLNAFEIVSSEFGQAVRRTLYPYFPSCCLRRSKWSSQARGNCLIAYFSL